MDSQLQSVSKIFTEKLFRIPDYQRGYAWGDKQLKDYWSDILQLEPGKNHYVGVLTLEKVPKVVSDNWEEDEWIMKSKSFEPFYVVDGQQRMTTTIILVQAITELYKDRDKLNYTEIYDIKRRYIFDSKDDGISRSYIFGYEKDNPSYDFLKRNIFLETGGYNQEDTIYTHNLENAKKYFSDKLAKLSKEEVEVIYKKITQNLLFNIYTISSDIDVFIAFETMNNRGKPLSNLELLKNRLIYLSTKFEADSSEKNKLRKDINDSWKAIYHYLGKNRSRPLNDDVFLLNHFIVYFGHDFGFASQDVPYSVRHMHNLYRTNYERYLLEEKFTVRNILGHSDESDDEDIPESATKLTIADVHAYISSLQKSVEIWYNIFNPTDCKGFEDEEKIVFERILRMGTKTFLPLLLVCYQKRIKSDARIELLKALERYVFIHMLYAYRHYPEVFDFSENAININKGNKTVAEVTKYMNERVLEICKDREFTEALSSKFKNEDFYKWIGIKYFLFEYEQSLKAKTRTTREKINWDDFNRDMDDYITIEHIYPQTPRSECWTKLFNVYSLTQRKILNNSLGNLLPLSRGKNASLQNKCFTDKIDNENFVGFRYGSYSEIEISKKSSWTPRDILDRGIKLLEFMEERWSITLGDREHKVKMLGLEFMLAPKGTTHHPHSVNK